MARRPCIIARDAVLLLVGGLASLTVIALVFYRADGPRWPHHVVDGLTWVIVVTACGMFAEAGARKLAELARRHRTS
ncbi:MAG: hypothetical protein JWR55_3312 [Aeromicrobium sp.]|nr:hypothetical protein [Aeromicrobium sp.]